MYTRVYNLCPFYTIKPLFSSGNTFKICVLWLIKCIYKLAAINMYTCVHKYIVNLSFAAYNPKDKIWSYKKKDRAITSFKIYNLNPHILHILGFKSRFFNENLAHMNMQVSNRSYNHRLAYKECTGLSNFKEFCCYSCQIVIPSNKWQTGLKDVKSRGHKLCTRVFVHFCWLASI